MESRITKADKEIYIFDNDDEINACAISWWRQFSRTAINEHGYFAVALSGGNTPKNFYQSLAKQTELPWDKTHLFQVDERFVTREHADSNYKLLNDNLFAPLKLAQRNIHAIKTDVPIDKSLTLYQYALDNFFHLTAGERPQFDLIMLGIGEDGHTASLFPFQMDTFDTPKNVVATSGSHVIHQRITLTLPVIKAAKNIVFLVTGNNKAEIVKRVIDNDPKLPASFVKPTKGKLFFLLCDLPLQRVIPDPVS